MQRALVSERTLIDCDNICQEAHLCVSGSLWYNHLGFCLTGFKRWGLSHWNVNMNILLDFRC